MVQFRDETTGEVHIFDVTDFPVSLPLRLLFARTLQDAMGPLGVAKSHWTAKSQVGVSRRFAETLSGLDSPPQRPLDLMPGHLAAHTLRRGKPGLKDVSQVKGLLLRCGTDEFNPGFAAALVAATGKARPVGPRDSYTDSEFKRIVKAARADIRAARNRIRAGEDLLARWRAGDIEEGSPEWRRGSYLDYMAAHGDVPRAAVARGDKTPLPNFNTMRRAGFKTVGDAMGHLYLTIEDAAAFLVLLACLTGQNRGTLGRADATHHRTDDGSGAASGVVLVDLKKPRRSKYKAEMTVPLSEVPEWVTADGATYKPRKQLLSALGVYMLAVELGQRGREFKDSKRLLCWYATRGGEGRGRGVRDGFSERAFESAKFDERHGLTRDDGTDLQLKFGALRLTYLRRHGQPVAQTAPTLVRDYLMRDPNALAGYQQVVASTLEQQVAEARASLKIRVMSQVEVDAAATDLEATAQRMGLMPTTLQNLLNGRLTTVLTGCSDNNSGPYTPGGPCGASFLLCTACPCAVSLPEHLPVQVATHDALLARRNDLQPLDWAERYGPPWARLSELLNRQPTGAVDRARDAVTDEIHDLVGRLLSRELDL